MSILPLPSSFLLFATAKVDLTRDSKPLAETYDQLGARQCEHGKILIQELGVHAGERVLDVGCGTGLLTEHVANIVGETGIVVGIDPLLPRIEVASARARENLVLRIGNAEDLSAFNDESFDVVFLNSVFHWLPDKTVALREAHRVLKKGGRLGLSTAAKEQPHDSENLFQIAFGEKDTDAHQIPHKVSGAELSRLLEQTGFRTRSQRIRTFTDRFEDVDELIAFCVSSSFGNALANFDAVQRDWARRALHAASVRYRLRNGKIQLRRHLIFAIAEKG